jgi:hypothetical protein
MAHIPFHFLRIVIMDWPTPSSQKVDQQIVASFLAQVVFVAGASIEKLKN